MDVAKLITANRIRCERQASSQKQALDLLSQSLAQDEPGLSAGAILECLVSRERIGSTGLGDAVAMPHARVEGIDHSVGAFLRLGEPVDFGSPDHKPVDLLFGLLVPTECSDTEVGELRQLIKRLRDPALQEQLRQTDSRDEIYDLLTDSLTTVRKRLSA
jgi:PTS system nitrogen regulatory IIA component